MAEPGFEPQTVWQSPSSFLFHWASKYECLPWGCSKHSTQTDLLACPWVSSWRPFLLPTLNSQLWDPKPPSCPGSLHWCWVWGETSRSFLQTLVIYNSPTPQPQMEQLASCSLALVVEHLPLAPLPVVPSPRLLLPAPRTSPLPLHSLEAFLRWKTMLVCALSVNDPRTLSVAVCDVGEQEYLTEGSGPPLSSFANIDIALLLKSLSHLSLLSYPQQSVPEQNNKWRKRPCS